MVLDPSRIGYSWPNVTMPARAMARAAAAGNAFTHASMPKAQQSGLDAAAKLYAAARRGERLVIREAEAERLSTRQTRGAKLKP